MTLLQEFYLRLWYQALASPRGVELKCKSFSSTSSRLYSARKLSGDPELQCLVIRPNPHNPEYGIWIVKPAKTYIEDLDLEGQ